MSLWKSIYVEHIKHLIVLWIVLIQYHWSSRIVMMSHLTPLAPPDVAIMAIASTVSGDKVGITTTLSSSDYRVYPMNYAHGFVMFYFVLVITSSCLWGTFNHILRLSSQALSLWGNVAGCRDIDTKPNHNNWTSSNSNSKEFYHDDVIKWKTFPLTGALWGESTGHRWIPLTNASEAELWCFLWYASEQMVQRTIETPIILHYIELILTSP